MRQTTLKQFCSIFFLTGLWACSSSVKPTSHMVYASAAMKSAERATAERKSPDSYRKAENYYWRAKQAYLAREYQDASMFANLARRLAEESEKQAEIKSASSSFDEE